MATLVLYVLIGIIVLSLAVIALLVVLKTDGRGGAPDERASFVAWALAAWIVSTALFGSYFASVRLVGAFDLTVDRLAFMVLAGGAAVMAYQGRRGRGLSLSPDLWMALFWALCLISLSLHGFLPAHPAFAKPWFIFLEGYLLPFAAFFFAKYFLVSEADDRCVIWGLYLLGAVIVATSLMEGLGLRDYVFLRYIADKKILLHLDRARGPFLNAAFTGLALCIGCIAGLALLPLSRFPRRLLHLALLTLFVPAIYYTRTRSVYLMFVVIFVGVVAAMHTTYPKWKVYTLPLCLIGLALLLSSGRLASDSRTAGGLGQMREIAIRFELAAKSEDIISQYPYFGIGLAQFRSTAAFALNESEYQHNHLIGIAAELGLVGLGVYLCILGVLFRRLFGLFAVVPEGRFYNANFVFFLGLALVCNLVSNSFVEPSLHAYAGVNFYVLAGMADRLSHRFSTRRS